MSVVLLFSTHAPFITGLKLPATTHCTVAARYCLSPIASCDIDLLCGLKELATITAGAVGDGRGPDLDDWDINAMDIAAEARKFGL
jgi:hypothetical protein